MNFKEKFDKYYNRYTNKSQSYFYTNRLKKSIRKPFVYLGGIVIAYYTLKYIYYRQLYRGSTVGFEDRLDYVTRLTEENNRLLKEQKSLLDKIYYK
jgi:hypothetical protein